ncbi:major royal jelly protein 1-like [Cimex lectularius]|uniref:Bee-milk protein n=1 Tax=Cimex lectularius TaxID=79782 RepID=A0A8I6SN62_CIMLE|nr:major royal jelly protein 1-like [Cimex lectularius]
MLAWMNSQKEETLGFGPSPLRLHHVIVSTTISKNPMIVLFLCGLTVVKGELQVQYEWNVVNFQTPAGFPVNPDYDGTSTPIFGMEKSGDGRVFVSTPRIWPGNPATLSVVSDQRDSNGSLLLQAYPDWSWHKSAAKGKEDDCKGLISVYGMRLDQCQNLWVLDSSIFNLQNYKVVCPPKILIFDTRTNDLVKKILLPRNLMGHKSLFTNIVLHTVGTNCLRTTAAFLSDTYSPAIVTYNTQVSRFTRSTHPSMNLNPNAESFSILGETFRLSDCVLGMAVDSNRKELYFQPLSSFFIFKVKVNDLLKGKDGHRLGVTRVANKSSQSAGLDFGPVESGKEVLVYSEISENNIVFLDPTTSEKRVVAVSAEKLQFVSDIKIKNGELLLASIRLQKFILSSINSSDTNLRIMKFVSS